MNWAFFISINSMKLNLTRPLCVFDLETTGIQITKDRIVQIAIVRINTDGKEDHYNRLVNPEMVIPEEIVAIHGISNERVKNEPTIKEIAQKLREIETLVNYNSKLKTESGVTSTAYGPGTTKALTEISKRLIKISERVRSLGE